VSIALLCPVSKRLKRSDMVRDTTLLVAQHRSIDIDQEYTMSLLGQLKTSYLLILTKLKKLLFTVLLLETLLFCLLCQELKELNKQRYLELM